MTKQRNITKVRKIAKIAEIVGAIAVIICGILLNFAISSNKKVLADPATPPEGSTTYQTRAYTQLAQGYAMAKDNGLPAEAEPYKQVMHNLGVIFNMTISTETSGADGINFDLGFSVNGQTVEWSPTVQVSNGITYTNATIDVETQTKPATNGISGIGTNWEDYHWYLYGIGGEISTGDIVQQGQLKFESDPKTTLSIDTAGTINIQSLKDCTVSYIKWEGTAPYTRYIQYYFDFGQNSTEGQRYIKIAIPTENLDNYYVENQVLYVTFPNGINGDADDVTSAYNQGYNVGFDSGKNTGYNQGYNIGYNNGVVAGTEQSGVVPQLLLSLGGVPFETLQSILNFEIFGVNISSLAMGLLTCVVVVAVLKRFV